MAWMFGAMRLPHGRTRGQRLQTVSQDSNPLYYRLIRSFGEATGTPVLLNTSFNENEPVVNQPDEAIDCYRRTKMDTLVVGKAWLHKHG